MGKPRRDLTQSDLLLREGCLHSSFCPVGAGLRPALLPAPLQSPAPRYGDMLLNAPQRDLAAVMDGGGHLVRPSMKRRLTAGSLWTALFREMNLLASRNE